MISRRSFLRAGGTLVALGSPIACQPSAPISENPSPLGAAGSPLGAAGSDGVVVNDIHSQLNPTTVRRIAAPDSLSALQGTVRAARSEGAAVSIAGGRHAMGGQQFGTDTVLLDTSGLSDVLDFDADRGIVEVEAGIQWPQLIDYLSAAQSGSHRRWGIVQKQTGADRLSIGGAVAANVHGRGLVHRPIIQDVESFVLIDADGNARRCSRDENVELFALAVGGYGCFGVIASLRLRLGVRRRLERIVEIVDVGDASALFEERIGDGFLYGDLQYGIANDSDDFLSRGVFACYRPVDDEPSIPEQQRELSGDDWMRLAALSHADKQQAFEAYSQYYLSTSGQRYWSDTHQLSDYYDNYHELLTQQLGEADKASDPITEIYVPRARLADFMAAARTDFRRHKVNVIYGTIRLIEQDDESFLAWATQPWACIIFNIHTVHTPAGIEHSRQTFRRLIDLALARGGCYYLTYHRYASRQQVQAAYPRFSEFLRLKQQYDPDERFQSDWYRHYREMFADVL